MLWLPGAAQAFHFRICRRRRREKFASIVPGSGIARFEPTNRRARCGVRPPGAARLPAETDPDDGVATVKSDHPPSVSDRGPANSPREPQIRPWAGAIPRVAKCRASLAEKYIL